MLLRRTLTVFAAIGLLLAPVTTQTATAHPSTIQAGRLTECSESDHHGDKRLGPEKLPVLGAVGFQLIGYRRTGALAEQRFLDTYYDQAAASWRYPPKNGYVLRPDGTPIQYVITLTPGKRIDRYGSEYGSFLAPKGSPYASRAIPPQSLDSSPGASCNYHAYRVAKSFAVHSGPIAAWFAQPGGGFQYQVDGALLPGSPPSVNVGWLIANGFLERSA
ncbi:TNT domain-containing protein [Amycolatopsis sp. cmx-11-51]|uniref:TNT domain-containing protein n=1 Tax=unclassified Amycolatopsis TaxID=2618356 RepID=UPI0039E3029F